MSPMLYEMNRELGKCIILSFEGDVSRVLESNIILFVDLQWVVCVVIH